MAFVASSYIEATFNKEGIAIFVIFSSMLFFLACCAAWNAWQSGHFQGVEGCKYDMFDDPIHDKLEIN